MKTKLFLFLISFTLMLGMTSCDDLEYDSNSSIAGTVIDVDTGEPIEGALITLTPGGLNTYTGYDGSFEFIDLNAKQYTLTAQKTGYNTNRKTVTSKAGEMATVQIVMKKSE